MIGTARRKFYEARDYDPAMRQILDLIGCLYGIAERLRIAAAPTDERQRVRQSQSAGIVDQIHGELVTLHDRFLPKSGAGKAITYTLGLWGKLTRFLCDGRMEIDNNLVENAIRPPASAKRIGSSLVTRVPDKCRPSSSLSWPSAAA